MTKFRILFIESSRDGIPGGSFFSALLLIRELAKRQFVAHILFYNPHDLVNEFKRVGAIVLTPIYRKKRSNENLAKRFERKKNNLFLGWMKTKLRTIIDYHLIINFILFDIRQIFFIVREIKKNKIDIVHLNNGIRYNRDGIIAAKICGVKCVVHERKIRDYDSLDIFLSKYIDVLIAISNAVYENSRRYPLKCKKIKRIYNPIRIKKVDDSKVQKIKFENGNLPIISIIGNIIPWKGQLKFLEAIDIIYNARNYTKIVALIIGSAIHPIYYEQLKQYCKQKEMEKCVRFVDFVYDIENYMQASDIIVHASQEPEPFGRVVAEAISLGKIVIATNLGGPKEIVVHKENGLLFEANRSEDLADKILRVLSGSFSVKEKQISQRALKRFSSMRHANEVIECYDSICKY